MKNISTIFGSMITNYARCTREIKYRIAMVKAFDKTLLTSSLDLNVKEKQVECYISRDAETRTRRKS